MRFFQAIRDFPVSYSQHNVALKFMREMHGSMEAVELPEWINVPEITHFFGESYAFQEGAATWWWSWTQMIAALTSESMETVVKGPGGHSRGVVRCEFAPRRHSYDDLTSRMLVKVPYASFETPAYFWISRSYETMDPPSAYTQGGRTRRWRHSAPTASTARFRPRQRATARAPGGAHASETFR